MKNTIFSLFLVGFHITNIFSQTLQSNNMEKDFQHIQQTVTAIFNGADERNWQKVKYAFSDTVLLDYTSFVGGQPARLSPEQIVNNWKGLLPGFDRTNHAISDFDININGDEATVRNRGFAAHYLKGEQWTVSGTYDFHLVKKGSNWTTDKMVFNFKEQGGNTTLAQKAMDKVKADQVEKRPIAFNSEGLILRGVLYLPKGFDPEKQYSTVVIAPTWLSVKEQMAGLYAERLAENGFVALAFDFRNFGESEGQPRQFESPNLKIRDLQNTVTYLLTQPFVNPSDLTGLGICAGAGYIAHAAAQDKRIKKVVTVAAWLHNPSIVEVLYGGKENVQKLISIAEDAAAVFAQTGEVKSVMACSSTDPTAAMYLPDAGFDYYLNPKKGAIPAWKNEFALMTWKEWLTFDAISAADGITQPLYMIHSDNAAVPMGARQFYEQLKGEKKSDWLNEFNQLEFYIEKPAVDATIERLVDWLVNEAN
jgi:uncharacterized protein